MVEVLIAEMFGSDRIDPTDYQRAVVVDGRGSKKTRKTTLRSGWRSVLKKSLTEPVLLEMSGYGVYQACGLIPSGSLFGSKFGADLSPIPQAPNKGLHQPDPCARSLIPLKWHAPRKCWHTCTVAEASF
jgi:hypothetical protein